MTEFSSKSLTNQNIGRFIKTFSKYFGIVTRWQTNRENVNRNTKNEIGKIKSIVYVNRLYAISPSAGNKLIRL